MDLTTEFGLVPAEHLDDAQLRQELAATHQIEQAVKDRCTPEQWAVLRIRLAELDGEYLRRFPEARATWPWAVPDEAPV